MVANFEFKHAFHYENGFYLTSEPYRMANILAHYELYKKILKLPGDVLELGVFKGSSLIQFSTFRELLESNVSRKIVGFDTFGTFPESLNKNVESDSKFIEDWNKQFEKELVSREDILESLEYKKIQNVELIPGDIHDTIPQYIKDHPNLRIALLHLDMDVYAPTKFALENLMNRVVTGGVVVIDDYATVEGATLAVEEFLSDKPYVLKKLRCAHRKPSFFVKK